MTNEIMIAGFGGQGVMAIGKTLAEAKERAALKVYAPTCSVLALWATKEEPQIMAVMMGNTT